MPCTVYATVPEQVVALSPAHDGPVTVPPVVAWSLLACLPNITKIDMRKMRPRLMAAVVRYVCNRPNVIKNENTDILLNSHYTATGSPDSTSDTRFSPNLIKPDT